MIKMTKNIRTFLLFSGILLVLSGLATLVGCGGGSSSDPTMSPEELEVATVVDAFATAITEMEQSQAMTFVDTNLKYYGGANVSQILDYSNFNQRLGDFFALASSIKCEIIGVGITLSSDTLASARGQLFLDYTSGGIEKRLTESIELKLEKTGKIWGIVEFAQYGTAGTTVTQFPPTN